jgi:hypothetical protein
VPVALKQSAFGALTVTPPPGTHRIDEYDDADKHILLAAHCRWGWFKPQIIRKQLCVLEDMASIRFTRAADDTPTAAICKLVFTFNAALPAIPPATAALPAAEAAEPSLPIALPTPVLAIFLPIDWPNFVCDSKLTPLPAIFTPNAPPAIPTPNASGLFSSDIFLYLSLYNKKKVFFIFLFFNYFMIDFFFRFVVF